MQPGKKFPLWETIIHQIGSLGNQVLYELWSSIVSAVKIKRRIIFAVNPPNEVQPTNRSKPCKASEHWTLFIIIDILLILYTLPYFSTHCPDNNNNIKNNNNNKKREKKSKRIYATEKLKVVNLMGFEKQFISRVMLLSQESIANAEESTTANMCFVVIQEIHRGSLTGERNQLIKMHKEKKTKILQVQIFSISSQQCLQDFVYPYPFNNILEYCNCRQDQRNHSMTIKEEYELHEVEFWGGGREEKQIKHH